MNKSIKQNFLTANLPLLKFLGVTLAYFLTGKLGLSVAYSGSYVTLFWLPSGIAVATMLHFGWRSWPAVYLGALLVNLSVDTSVELSMGLAVGNTLAPALTAWLFKRFNPDLTFNRRQDSFLLFLAAAIGMLVSAGNGALVLWLGHQIGNDAVIKTFAYWWMGDSVGVLLATPLLISDLRTGWHALWKTRNEGLVWSGIALTVSWLVFFTNLAGNSNFPLAFLPLPLAVWAALRFGVFGAAISTLTLSFLAVLGTSFGGGPFHGVPQNIGLLLLWVYMVTLLLTTLMVTSLLAEQHQTETLLKSSLAKTKLLQDASLDAVVSMDHNGVVVEWNKQAEKIFGYPREQAIGCELGLLIVPPDLREAHRQGLARFLASKATTIIGKRIEVRGMRSDGHEFPIELTIAMLENQGQYFFSAYIRDISDRKLALEALRQSEQIAKSSLEELKQQKFALDNHAIVAVTDVQGRITYANNKFCEVSGYALEELLGQDHAILNSGHHPKGFFKDMYRTVTRGKTWHQEVCNKAKDGHLYWVDTTISPFMGDDGKPQSYISIRTDITQRMVAEEKSSYLALYDALTQLPNRRLLLDRLSQAQVSSTRNGKKGALLFLDLDHFKTLNDTLGHDVGDLLLQQVAGRLTACVREGDTVARLGGDEFVVLLEDLSESKLEAATNAEIIGEKILLSLNQPYQLGTHEYLSTPSIGATLFDDHQFGKEDLLKQADIAMYAAKKAGRNALRFFDPKMQLAITTRVDMERELREALELGQFKLHYQVQVDASGKAFGAEALIRWDHPERSIISPFYFIPLAEETGLILPIGHWVLNTACAQLKQWQQDPLSRDLILAVNVSAKQFHQADFVAQVTSAVERHGIDATRLKLELTESLLVDNIDEVISTMYALKAIGIKFSLDDFGTGYSSLQYLKSLPLDQLKIDQSFVRDIVNNVSDKAIALTIITMSHILGLDVIAEGVETEEQRQMLLDNDCTHYQGYLFSKPVPIAEFNALLKTMCS